MYIPILAYLQTPGKATVCLGSVSNISCASANAQTIYYIVNGTTVPSSALSGFSVSAPIPIVVSYPDPNVRKHYRLQYNTAYIGSGQQVKESCSWNVIGMFDNLGLS